MSLVTALIHRRDRLLGRLAQEAVALHGTEVPGACEIGPGAPARKAGPREGARAAA
ncbi:hypothetical protein ACWCXH_35100 [Kitasatospora sp. NPDC001660]